LRRSDLSSHFDYFLKLNVAFFSHWRLEAHIPLHCHPEYWWRHSYWCPHQPKYWWGYVPGIPGGVDAYDFRGDVTFVQKVGVPPQAG